MNFAAREAFWGSLIGDSLAMPVHWFYDVPQIKEVYGKWIDDYVPPKNEHWKCGLGQGSSEKPHPVVGRLILHDKGSLWQTAPKGTHYHQGMVAGDNTLNTVCAISVANSLQATDPERNATDWDLLAEHVLQNYVTLMTTPGTHRDTWAEEFHRNLFTDWEKAGSPKDGKSILQFFQKRKEEYFFHGDQPRYHMCGGLVMAIPWVLHYSSKDENECIDAAWRFVSLTHPSPGFKPFVQLFASSLHKVVNGAPLQQIARNALESTVFTTKPDYEQYRKQLHGAEDSEKQLAVLQAAGKEAGLDCSIHKALQIVFFLADVFAGDLPNGLLANVNIGGDNCHRGSALGALLGAASVSNNRMKVIPEFWKNRLQHAADVNRLIDSKYWQ